MTKDQARQGHGLHRRWRRLLSTRLRHQPGAPTAALADHAPLMATSSSRPPLASLFDPDQPDPPPPIAAATPAVAGTPRLPWPPRRTVSTWLLLVPALTLAAGATLGFALGSRQTSREAASAVFTSSPSPATQPVPPPSTKLVVRFRASPACLESTRRGDRLIDLLIRNQRSQAERLLVAYTVAARQCRNDASPIP
jgi:hypothetical protein